MQQSPLPALILKPKREKSVLNRHPWIFSGAVAQVEGEPRPGDTVDVLTTQGRWLARAAYSPRSQIRARIWAFDPSVAIDDRFFEERIEAALAHRRSLLKKDATTAVRLVNAESDGLPGLIVDHYDRWTVCQFLSTGSERWKAVVVEALARLMPNAAGIYERSDVDVRRKEGLSPTTGRLWGDAPPARVEIEENGCRYHVDIREGHKTGFYLDQRDNRRWVAAYAASAEVLNCFAYTGGFAVAALKAGASRVVNVDTSTTALALAESNVALNRLDASRVEFVPADVFEQLRRLRAAGGTFDLIVLDPPKFATSKGDLMRASRGYKDINRLAFELLNPGGMLFTFSCSGLMGRELFQKIVADAALDAGRPAMIVHWLSQSPDHPTALNFPEGAYLKGLVCRVA